MLGVQRNANGRTDLHTQLAQRPGLAQCVGQALGQRHGLVVVVDAALQHGKLIAPQPRHKV